MAGVWLGMSTGTLIALGITATLGTVSVASNVDKANKAKRAGADANRLGDQLTRKAIDRIGASNYMRQLTVNKKASEDAMDSLIAAQGSQQLGVGDQRGASAGSARQQATMLKGLSQTQQFEIDQQQAIQEAIAKEDIRIAQQIGAIELGQANQQYKDSKAYQQQEAAYKKQATDAAINTAATVGTAVVPAAVESIDTGVKSQQLTKQTSSAIGVNEGSETPVGDYLGSSITGMSEGYADDGTFDTNEALKGVMLSNETFGTGLGEMLYTGATDEELTNYLLNNLSDDEYKAIMADISQQTQ